MSVRARLFVDGALFVVGSKHSFSGVALTRISRKPNLVEFCVQRITAFGQEVPPEVF